MDVLNPIYTEPAQCQDCYKCLRECTVKAIKVIDGHAKVVPELCILCGHCVSICPVQAKRVRWDVEKAKLVLKTKRAVYVSLAPSFVAEFTEIEQKGLCKALRTLGFAGVSETALGAEIVSANLAQDLIPRESFGLALSSACPVAVEYVKKYLPPLASFITPISSPLMAHAKFLKQRYGEDIGVVFVGPCIGKKREADNRPDLLDVALGFQELRSWLEKEGIDLLRLGKEELFRQGQSKDKSTKESKEEPDFVPFRSGDGTLYPLDGGMVQTIKNRAKVSPEQFFCFSGMKEIQRALERIDESDLLSLPFSVFVELLACGGGCVNGPLCSQRKGTLLKQTQIQQYHRKALLTLSAAQKETRLDAAFGTALFPKAPPIQGLQVTSLQNNRLPHQDQNLPTPGPSILILPSQETGGQGFEQKLDLTYTWDLKPLEQTYFPEAALKEALAKIGKYNRQDELNCGGCGYDTCRQFAVAFLQNKAETTMCVSYMRKLAQKKADALIKTMPSGVVVVDEDLKIVECNRNFASLLGKEVEELYDTKPGLEKASLQKLLPFANLFETVLETGIDLVERDIRYRDKVLRGSIFIVEPRRFVGGVFQDITLPFTQKDKIVEQAEKIIRKQLSTVQKIAYLLGENAAESEVMLNAIIQSFGPEGRECKPSSK